MIPSEKDAGGSDFRLYDGSDLKLFSLVGWAAAFSSVAWPTGVQLMILFFFRFSMVVFDNPVIFQLPRNTLYRSSTCL